MGHSNDKDNRIRDNYTFKKMSELLNGAAGFKEIAHQLNIDMSNVEEAKKTFEIMQNLPDKFNDIFADYGWIAYESLSYEVMKKSVVLAEQGKIGVAEEVLFEHFNDKDTIFIKILALNKIPQFKPRMPLLKKALNDHFEKRYHASVPLFLMLIDGFVNDFEQIGFFAEDVDLEVWDTIAAHNTGLKKIAKIYGSSRKKTRVEEITLPYRNGILHGRDLGYDNIKVSAKALSTLLALGDWANAIKKGKKGVQKEYTTPSNAESLEALSMALKSYRQTNKEKEHMKSFKKRDLIVGKDIPYNGEVTEYYEDTPERAVVGFLNSLKKKNYGSMANLISQHFNKKKTISKLAGELREIFKRKELLDFKLISIEDIAPAVSIVNVKLDFQNANKKQYEYNHKFTVNYEDEEGKVVARGFKKADWKIQLMSIKDLEYIEYNQRNF
ncbi:hypothetical protein SLL00_16625 [Metabacillus indicus]|uniref:hypothetical protein n=1 Tax=Metabacillus indicus TaxID=246786 RepID=UPI002A0994A7|nr:hypothetical protein [Metabacillus indicus]MDX8291437.1 hypothetical protein [Metabacillus indicus]